MILQTKNILFSKSTFISSNFIDNTICYFQISNYKNVGKEKYINFAPTYMWHLTKKNKSFSPLLILFSDLHIFINEAENNSNYLSDRLFCAQICVI